MEFPVLTLLTLPSAVVLLSTVRLRLQMGLFLLRAILRESEANLEMKNFKAPSFFVWR